MVRIVFNKKQPEMGQGREPSPRKWSPRELWTPAMILLIVKLLLFAVLRCSETSSWGALLDIRLYARTILLTFILSIPIGMFRRRWLQLAIHLAADICCICLLAQGGGSLTHLPVVGWLLPLTTLLSLGVCLKYRERKIIALSASCTPTAFASYAFQIEK